MHVCLYMYVSVLHICITQEDQKKALDLLELELQVIVFHHLGAGN